MVLLFVFKTKLNNKVLPFIRWGCPRGRKGAGQRFAGHADFFASKAVFRAMKQIRGAGPEVLRSGPLLEKEMAAIR
jgi:hypothetical protein